MFKFLQNALSGEEAGHLSGRRHILPTKVPASLMPHQMDTVRWHGDIRPCASVLFLHDVGSTAAAWSGFTNEVSRLPAHGVSPVVPLQLYVPHLRNHGHGVKAPSSVLGDYVNDVVSFSETVVDPTTTLHVIGHGFGARLALLAALTLPARFASVTALTTNDLFAPIKIPEVKLRLLQSTVAECNTMAAAEEALLRHIADTTERRTLLSALRNNRAPRDITSRDPSPTTTSLSIATDVEELLHNFASTSTRWPELKLPNGHDGPDQNEVMTALKNTTTDLNVVKSCLPGTGKLQEVALRSLFTKIKTREMPCPLDRSVLREEDVTVLTLSVLDQLKLLGGLPEEGEEQGAEAEAGAV